MTGGPYPTYGEIRSRRLAERRAAALAAVRAAEALVQDAGGRLVVFGSLAESRFDERSDVDVAVMGLTPDRENEVAVRIFLLLEEAGFDCDILFERSLTPSLRERIETRGREPRALG